MEDLDKEGFHSKNKNASDENKVKKDQVKNDSTQKNSGEASMERRRQRYPQWVCQHCTVVANSAFQFEEHMTSKHVYENLSEEQSEEDYYSEPEEEAQPKEAIAPPRPVPPPPGFGPTMSPHHPPAAYVAPFAPATTTLPFPSTFPTVVTHLLPQPPASSHVVETVLKDQFDQVLRTEQEMDMRAKQQTSGSFTRDLSKVHLLAEELPASRDPQLGAEGPGPAAHRLRAVEARAEEQAKLVERCQARLRHNREQAERGMLEPGQARRLYLALLQEEIGLQRGLVALAKERAGLQVRPNKYMRLTKLTAGGAGPERAGGGGGRGPGAEAAAGGDPGGGDAEEQGAPGDGGAGQGARPPAPGGAPVRTAPQFRNLLIAF
jgi:hypothetical protein